MLYILINRACDVATLLTFTVTKSLVTPASQEMCVRLWPQIECLALPRFTILGTISAILCPDAVAMMSVRERKPCA